MAQVLTQWPATPLSQRHQTYNHRDSVSAGANPHGSQLSWDSLQSSLNCNSRFYCLFSDNRKQEQARKALESALGGKKTEFEKWDKEIKRREEAGGGGDIGGGGWFGRWSRWFGDGDHFWQEAQQIGLTILGIVTVFLIVAKGDVMLAVVLNPLLLSLRKTRDGLTFLTSLVTKKINPASSFNLSKVQEEEVSTHVSARQSVVKKWGSD
ncbi:OLC1v1020811C2 [Oldenlandia corymbosa var. corymbosa]|uniref:OLC1v1020811C2 n=1 Tax=Oldenlandia corymbosa var. corymbosa TaxID=529605 RepID=A0AAV1BVS0_OLDCO|nr:OLC1v1020811C2 [Oldenlandia corymbosa var. corymbosa]